MNDPVVVKPEPDSKTASIKDGIALERKKGRLPMIPIETQTKETMIYPSNIHVFDGIPSHNQ